MGHDLDHASLQALLDALGTDSDEAGLAYENLRLRLIRFFRWNQCLEPEGLADEALDRLAGKIAGGSEPVLDPGKYIAGIARMLLHEQRARESRDRKMLSALSWHFARRQDQEEELARYEDALSLCLDQMAAESRRLLERYYMGDAGERIRTRQSLAAELGIGINALRNRALRLRRQLEECTSRYFARASQRDGSLPDLTKEDRSLS